MPTRMPVGATNCAKRSTLISASSITIGTIHIAHITMRPQRGRMNTQPAGANSTAMKKPFCRGSTSTVAMPMIAATTTVARTRNAISASRGSLAIDEPDVDQLAPEVQLDRAAGEVAPDRGAALDGPLPAELARE